MSNRCPRCNFKAHLRCKPSQMFVWHQYVCRGCGAKLRQTLRHRFVVCLPLALIGTAIQIVGAQSQSPPLVIAGAAVTGIALAVMLYFDRIHVVSTGPFCTKCEYDLTAVPEGAVCPECGHMAITGGEAAVITSDPFHS